VNSLWAALVLAVIPFAATSYDFGPRWVEYEPEMRGEECTDARRLDVRNMRFRPRLPEGAFEVSLKKGKATRADDRSVSAANWRTNLVEDRVATLEGGTAARFVRLYDVHDTSATSREYLFVLDCADGRARQVFEAGGEGLRIELRKIKGGEFRLTWAVWHEGDSHATPSRERLQTYVWTPSHGRFAKVADEERAVRTSN